MKLMFIILIVSSTVSRKTFSGSLGIGSLSPGGTGQIADGILGYGTVHFLFIVTFFNRKYYREITL
jgi:hypothetical protein